MSFGRGEAPCHPVFPVSAEATKTWRAKLVHIASKRRGWRLAARIGAASALLLLAWQSLGLLVLQDRLSVADRQFLWGSLILDIAGLIWFGPVAGYLTERDKSLQAQALSVNRILRNALAGATLQETFQEAIQLLFTLFRPSRILLVLQEAETGKSYVWKATGGADLQSFAVMSSEVSAEQANPYFFPPRTAGVFRRRMTGGQGACCVQMNHGEMCPACARASWIPLWRSGSSSARASATCGLVKLLDGDRTLRSVLAAGISAGTQWSGRLFLYNARVSGRRPAALRTLERTARQLAPIIYDAYLIRRLRAHARNHERLRVARELHDGLVQSLSALAMRFELLRRQVSETAPGGLARQMEELEGMLRAEILSVRDTVHTLHFKDLSAPQLLNALAELVSRFQRETAIHATFESELDQVTLSPQVSREVALIVLEALVNVRKHSKARQAAVRLGTEGASYRLVIEDDGRGFDFSGRWSQAQLKAYHQGPRVLTERVETIGGELTIDSEPGKGAKLRVLLPRAAHGY